MGFISEKLAQIAPSATIAMTERARQMRSEGRDVIALSAGEPDFDTPEHIKQAAMAAIAEGRTKYTPVAGISELRAAICEKFRRENGLSHDAEEICVASGAKQIIYNAMMGTLNPGDEVIIPAPCWVSYPDIVRLAGGRPVIVPTDPDTGKMSARRLAGAIGRNTKWLIINSPCNPSGIACNSADLEAIAAVLAQNEHILVLADDIYEHLVYDHFEFHTLAQIAPNLKERILTVNGVSKAYAMTGWRIGYAGGPRVLIDAMVKLQSQSTSCANSVAQWAAIAALCGPQDAIGRNAAVFAQRRARVLKAIGQIAPLRAKKPDGAFYVFVSCAELIGKCHDEGQAAMRSDTDVAQALLEFAQIAVVPGRAFGQSPFLRLSYSIDDVRLDEALRRLEAFCQRVR